MQSVAETGVMAEFLAGILLRALRRKIQRASPRIWVQVVIHGSGADRSIMASVQGLLKKVHTGRYCIRSTCSPDAQTCGEE